MKFGLIVGHTDTEEGAVMTAPYSCSEYVYGRVLADITLGILIARHHDAAVILRMLPGAAGIDRAYADVKAHACVATVELHFNSSNEVRVKGTEVLVGLSVESLTLGQLLQRRLCAIFNRREKEDRGVKVIKPHERGGRSVNPTNGIPGVLIEPFFGSNREDACDGLFHIHNLGVAIASGLIAYGERLGLHAPLN